MKAKGAFTTATDLIGRKFGRATVLVAELRPLIAGRPGTVMTCDCRCTCGREFTVRSKDLLNGNTRSCGCIREERTREVKRIAGLRRGQQMQAQGAQTRLRVVEYLFEIRKPVRVKDVAEHIGHTDASAYAHLQALIDRRIVRREGTLYVVNLNTREVAA